MTAAPIRILGIDPGLATTGFGVVDQTGNSFRLIEYGTLCTPPGEVLAERLVVLRDAMSELLARHSPHEAAVEQLFFNVNVRTALSVGQARGVALLALADAGLPVSEYTPSEVKLAVVGYGSADKQQVQYMVRTILAMTETPKPDDAADALAIAICHAHSRTLVRRKELSK
jgi:crossover junction endodeoxyribonuclease RuvC